MASINKNHYLYNIHYQSVSISKHIRCIVNCSMDRIKLE